MALLQHADVATGAGSCSGLLGLVHGSAVNQDGRSSSLTAPNGPAQTALVRAALGAAGAAPLAVGFVSMHGTGAAAQRSPPQAFGLLAEAALSNQGEPAPPSSAPPSLSVPLPQAPPWGTPLRWGLWALP